MPKTKVSLVNLTPKSHSKTHHPLSAPPLKKLQSPFATQSHPPPTPLPLCHPGTVVSGRTTCVPGANTDDANSLPSSPSASPFKPIPSRLANVLNPAVNTLKSSSPLSAGIFPVRALPIAINGAACEQIKMALLVLSAGSWAASRAAISASASAMRRARVVATRSWSWAMDSPRVEG